MRLARGSTAALLPLLLLSSNPLLAGCSTVWGFEDGTLVSSGGSGAYGGTGAAGAGAGAAGSGAWTQTTTTVTATTGTSSGGAAGTGGGGGAPLPECTPDATQDVGDCERCGDLIEHCNASGFWDPAVCEGQGECEAGASSQSDCEECGQRVCSSTCHFGACEVDPGKQCLWEEGENWEYCNGDYHSWRWCLPSCVWASCDYCACNYCVASC